MTKLAPANERLLKALRAEVLKSNRASNAIWLAHTEAVVNAYVAARDARDALAGETVTSYSIAGRSFTRANLDDLSGMVRDYGRELAALIPAADVLLAPGSATFCGIDFSRG